MRFAIYGICLGRRPGNYHKEKLATRARSEHSVRQVVDAPITRRNGLLRFVRFVQQQAAFWRLRQRLARYPLFVPLLRYFSADEIDDIHRAVKLLGLVGAQDAVDAWPQLCTPFVTGDRAGIDAVGVLGRHDIVNLKRCGPDGETLLHVVARSGIVAVVAPSYVVCERQCNVSVGERVRLLVSLGVDPDQPNAFGDVPLQLAWQRASELGNRIAGALLEAGCNPMKRDRFGTTLLHRAARANNLAVVRGWCDSGLHTNPTGGLCAGRALLQTPLMFAVMAGHRRCVDVLIDKERRASACGETKINDGQRLIEQARQHSKYDGAQIQAGNRLLAQGRDLLTDARASLDFADSFGATALHWAVDFSRPDLAELLLLCGADRYRRAGRSAHLSWTCAQLASARADLQAVRPILSLLLKYGVHPDQPLLAVDQAGWRRACKKGFQR